MCCWCRGSSTEHQAGRRGGGAVRRLVHRLEDDQERPARRQDGPGQVQGGGGHGASNKNYGPALIDNHTPPPAQARFSLGKLIVTTLVFLVLGLGVLLALSPSSDLTKMGEFFTGAAFLTIGGAYAALPYVYRGAVEHLG